LLTRLAELTRMYEIELIDISYVSPATESKNTGQLRGLIAPY